MISVTLLMQALVVVYVVVAVVFGLEGNFNKMFYWIGKQLLESMK